VINPKTLVPGFFYEVMYTKKIALGTVQFGMDYGISKKAGQTPFEEVKKLLNYAEKNHIKTIDTAFGYGDSEVVLGKLLNERFEVITKFLPESLAGTIQSQLETSLNHLKVDQVYGYLAHRPKDLLENINIWEKLKEFKDQNKVQKIGFSLNEPEEYFSLKANGCIPDLVQLPYNYLDNRFNNVIKELKDNNCEVHTRSVFLQGLFFMNPEGLSGYFSEVVPVLKKLQHQFKSKLPGALLKYVLSNELIDKVVIGVQNLQQLQDNLKQLETATLPKPFDGHLPDSILQPSQWVV